ncbi:MAG: YidC/Oxa1 family membrane protein insertase [Actinomycetota bacterium]
MFDAIATVLAWFYELYHNYAFAIAALTFVIFVLLFPLNLKANRSMMAMQAYQPEMKKIQQQYKDDKQKQQEELLKFYQEKGINPLGGCLPLLIQMPIFLVLFRVINGLTRRGADGETFDPDYLDTSAELYTDLAGSTQMLSFGVDLAESANGVLRSAPLESLPYLALVGVTGIISWYQQKQMRYRQSKSNTQLVGPQQTLMKIMPFFLPVFSFFVPAALVVYFIVSGVFRVGQQAYIIWSNEKKDHAEEAAARAAKRRGRAGDGAASNGGTGEGNGNGKGGNGRSAAANRGSSDNGSGEGNGERPHPKSRQSGKRKGKGKGKG